jgi:hypothetical protein
MAIYNKDSKYYFYKLYNDFFQEDAVEYLKQTDSGSKTLIIYLQLIFLTINKKGYLEKKLGDDRIPYSGKELANKIGVDEKEFKKHLDVLIKFKFIEIRGEFYYIPAGIKLVEKTSGARSKEDQRARQLMNEDDSAPCPPSCPPDIDIEERDKILDIKNLEVDLDDRTSGYNLYCSFVKKTEERFGRSLGSEEVKTLELLLEVYGQEEVKYALDEASRKDKKSVGYMRGILEIRNGEL